MVEWAETRPLLKKLHTGPSDRGRGSGVVRIIITPGRPLQTTAGGDRRKRWCVIIAQTQAGHYCAPRLAAAYIKDGPNQGPGTRQRGRAVHSVQS